MESKNSEDKIVKDAMDSLLKMEENVRFLNENELVEYSREHLKLIYCFHSPIKMPFTLYRTRPKSNIKDTEDMTSPSTFSYVPQVLNKIGLPTRGRLNLTSQSIFYASLIPSTNLKEMKDEIKEGDIVYISQWDIIDEAPISIYRVIAPDNLTLSINNKEGQLIIDDPHIVNGAIGDYLKYFGKLLLEKENNKYIITSLLANKILWNTEGEIERNGVKFDMHYDAIVYPSVASGLAEINFAIKPDFVDKSMSLKYVYKGIVKDQYTEIDFSHIGICSNNKIKWYESWIWEDDIHLDSYSFFDKNGELQLSNNFEIFNKGIKIDKIDEIIYKYFPFEYLKRNNFFKDSSPFGNIEDFIKNRSKPYFIKCNDLVICSNNYHYKILHIGVIVNYHISLEEVTSN